MKEENKNISIFKDGENYLMNTYSRSGVVFTKANMQYLWDAEGEKYIDFIAGYGCLNVGHSNKYVVDELKKQVSMIIQPSNIFYNEAQVKLGKKLCDVTKFGEKVFFANSGTESVEGAIKLARKYSTDKYDKTRYEIISFKQSFHGRTLGALSATAQPKKQNIFKPLMQGFKFADLNDKSSVEKLCDKKTCAILIEPIQGEGGVNETDRGFMQWLRDFCNDKDILLILDEIQTGFGRTGSMFAYEGYGIYPDILTLAKSLGGGMPIGAIVSTEEISKVFTPGCHGSTFGGNAASCAAGLAVIEYIENEKLCEKASVLGKYFYSRLVELKDKYKIIKEIRGKGLMVGLELNDDVAGIIVKRALDDKLIINKVSDFTLRFLPPLVIEKEQIDILINWLKNILEEF